MKSKDLIQNMIELEAIKSAIYTQLDELKKEDYLSFGDPEIKEQVKILNRLVKRFNKVEGFK